MSLSPHAVRVPDRVNILLVDDRPDKLLALEAILGDVGANLVKATSGREALKKLLARASSANTSPLRSGTTSGSSLPARRPSCSTRFHLVSKSASPRIGFQVSRTMS